MVAGLFADLVLALHLAFVLFVVFGGLLVLRWRRLAWVHLPAAAWGALVELAGWICPLTPLERRLRRSAGDAFTADSFLEQYLMPVLYPAALTREMQILLGMLVLAGNGIVYAVVLWRWRQRRGGGAGYRRRT